MAVAPVLRKQLMDLIEQGDTRVVVNMVDVDTIDSAILGSLLAALKVARNAGGDLRLVAPSEQTQQVLKMTSLADVFRTYDSVDTAFESE
jgi:anti-sigma B factor antagonist